MELFDIIKIIFEDANKYKEVSKIDKRKNFFMINRRFSIEHPFQANALNLLRINQEEAIDIWQRFIRKHYNKVPFWIYIKGVKKAKEDKEKKINVSSEIIEEYAKVYNYDKKSVYEALDLFPKEMISELHIFEKMINERG